MKYDENQDDRLLPAGRMLVPTTKGVFTVQIKPGPQIDMVWLQDIIIEDPEVAEEWEVVVIPVKFLLSKSGPRPKPEDWDIARQSN